MRKKLFTFRFKVDGEYIDPIRVVTLTLEVAAQAAHNECANKADPQYRDKILSGECVEMITVDNDVLYISDEP